MEKVFKISVPAMLIAILVVTGTAFAEHHAVKVAKMEGIGSYLTDIKGMTLYTFKKDTPG